MNWDDLRLFLAVARSGSISGAARQLDIQHSTVSRRMQKLEVDLGVRLLERKSSGFELTPAGDNLRQMAERMEREALGIDGCLLDQDARMAGPLRVTAINNMASSVLMPMFAGFSRQYPEVELHIQVSNADASLAQREADLAIRLTNSPVDTLIGRQVVRVASTLYASHDLELPEGVDDSELPWLGVECCEFHRGWTREACGQPDHSLVLDDTLLTQAALREGMGVSILPCFMGDTDPALRRVCEPRSHWDLGLWLLLHPDLKRTARVLRFRDYMIEAIQARSDLFEGHCPAG